MASIARNRGIYVLGRRFRYGGGKLRNAETSNNFLVRGPEVCGDTSEGLGARPPCLLDDDVALALATGIIFYCRDDSTAIPQVLIDQLIGRRREEVFCGQTVANAEFAKLLSIYSPTTIEMATEVGDGF